MDKRSSKVKRLRQDHCSVSVARRFFSMTSFHSRLSPIVLTIGTLVEPQVFANEEMNAFQEDYLTAEFAANYPAGNGREYFRTGLRRFQIGYTHLLNDQWGVGLSIGYKSLFRKDIDRELGLLSITNESFYITRLYHPVYLLTGTKIIYMAPNQRSKLPPLREPDYEVELGVGFSAKLTILDESWMYWLRLDRWRGTKTNRLHGFETAIGASYAL